MELTSTALVSLACLLSSGQPDQTANQDLVNNLNAEQVAIVQEVVKSGVCLPKSFEDKVQSGFNGDDLPDGSPTSDL